MSASPMRTNPRPGAAVRRLVLACLVATVPSAAFAGPGRPSDVVGSKHDLSADRRLVGPRLDRNAAVRLLSHAAQLVARRAAVEPAREFRHLFHLREQHVSVRSVVRHVQHDAGQAGRPADRLVPAVPELPRRHHRPGRDLEQRNHRHEQRDLHPGDGERRHRPVERSPSVVLASGNEHRGRRSRHLPTPSRSRPARPTCSACRATTRTANAAATRSPRSSW